MAPPVPDTVAAVPLGKTPAVLPIAMGTDEVPTVEASVTVITATTPLAIALEFIPTATHVDAPADAFQLRDLPAAVRDDPAPALKETILLGE